MTVVSSTPVSPGLKNIKTIRDFEITGKTIFLRLDLNVPLEKGQITDETRITAALPTVKYCLEKGSFRAPKDLRMSYWLH